MNDTVETTAGAKIVIERAINIALRIEERSRQRYTISRNHYDWMSYQDARKETDRIIAESNGLYRRI